MYESTTKPRRAAIDRKKSMWQLDNEATNASSGSTWLSTESGGGTTWGEAEAGTIGKGRFRSATAHAGGSLPPAFVPALLLAAMSFTGCDGAVRDLRSAASDSVRVEEIEIDFPSWRLLFEGEVREAVPPEDLTAAHIESLDVVLLPRARAGDAARRPSPATGPPSVTAQARLQGRVIGERHRAYELMTIVNHDVSIESPHLLGSIEDLTEPPDEFLLFDVRGEELAALRRPPEPLTLEVRRAEYRRGAVRLAWDGPPEAKDAGYQVFLSTDRFETYRQVHPGFTGPGERRAMRRTSYTLDLSEHHVDRPELFLLVLANDRLRVAWRAFRVTLERLPEYDYRIRVLEPAEGATIAHHWFFRLSGSMEVRVETPGERYDGRPYRWDPVDATLEWSSDVDGSLARYRTHGHGFQVHCPAHGLSPGVHHVTVTGETPSGVAATSTVRMEVVPEPGAVGGGPTECRVPDAYRID